MVCSPEHNVFDPEALGASAGLGFGMSAFSNSQKKVKGDVDQIANCLLFWVKAVEPPEEDVVGHSDGHCQFPFWGWVLSLKALHLLFEGWPIGCPALLLIGWAGFVVQLEGLGNGCQRFLNSLSSNLIFSSGVSRANPMGKGLDKGKLFWLGEGREEGVGDAEVGDKLGPVTPELFPRVVSLSHDPMGCCS